MSFLTMKDYSNYLTEKPFSCNVDGCSMKFTNEDHLNVHKKRHDMFLNIGLGPKGTTFTDQTPTPTQFIKNCEEVGLFQDLQNVNPFEEMFKKAADSVRSGQPLYLDKSFQSNPPDDTLHTPNVFPHITDVPNLGQQDKTENIPPCDDALLKPDMSDNKISKSDTALDHPIQQSLLTQSNESPISVTNVNSIEGNQIAENQAVILNVPEGHFVKLITPDNSQSSCNMVVIENPPDSIYPPLPLTVKEKLKKNITEKKTGKCFQLKVPITKCPTKKAATSFTNKFSKFSKNAMKLISKLENPNAGFGEINEGGTRRQKKKINDKYLSKESRSEFLARSRAASSRCREKKKMYVLYLEKVNGELSTAYQNLKLINMSQQKQIRDLHSELLKHKHCSVADKITETTLSATERFINPKLLPEQEGRSISPASTQEEPKMIDQPESITCDVDIIDSFHDLNEFQPLTLEEEINPHSSNFDVAEVILNEMAEENEIPLTEGKSSDIIVRFNSVGSDFPSNLPPDPYLGRFLLEGSRESDKQIYMEHSYCLKKPTVHVDQNLINYKIFKDSITTTSPTISDDCKKLDPLEMRLEKDNAFTDLTSLNTKVLLEPRNPPPLILLKPFKKRTLQNKQTEKT